LIKNHVASVEEAIQEFDGKVTVSTHIQFEEGKPFLVTIVDLGNREFLEIISTFSE
jgi:hypothetical protein